MTDDNPTTHPTWPPGFVSKLAAPPKSQRHLSLKAKVKIRNTSGHALVHLNLPGAVDYTSTGPLEFMKRPE